jgi:hypothetical protein
MTHINHGARTRAQTSPEVPSMTVRGARSVIEHAMHQPRRLEQRLPSRPPNVVARAVGFIALASVAAPTAGGMISSAVSTLGMMPARHALVRPWPLGRTRHHATEPAAPARPVTCTAAPDAGTVRPPGAYP